VNLNKDISSWAKLQPDSVMSMSGAAIKNVLTMALEDIQRLGKEHDTPQDEVARLRQALQDIVDPLGKLKRDAEAQGAKLSGMAYQIGNSQSYIQGIAKDALRPRIGHATGCTTINCLGCGNDFFSTDYR
jgi:hypothetical protein